MKSFIVDDIAIFPKGKENSPCYVKNSQKAGKSESAFTEDGLAFLLILCTYSRVRAYDNCTSPCS